jgi:lysophospholipase L1-like esterase
MLGESFPSEGISRSAIFRPKTAETIGQKPVVVFCGDSITRGEYSYDWVSHLKTIFGDRVDVHNEGYNSFTVDSYIKQKSENIINQYSNASDIIISLGTNDANAQWRHPEDPNYSKEKFRENYLKLINNFKDKLPNAKIAITTIPNIGEDTTHPAYKLGLEYNEIIKEVAAETKVELLPVFEMIQNEYKEDTREIKPKFKHTIFGEVASMAKNIFEHKILKKDYADIAQSSGYKKKVDELHLNKSAKVFAACSVWFIKKNHPSLQTS